MADDNDPKPTGSVECEFCGCRISRASGEMVSRSKRATAMMKLDDDLAKATETIDTLNATIVKIREELDTLKAVKPEPVGASREDWL